MVEPVSRLSGQPDSVVAGSVALDEASLVAWAAELGRVAVDSGLFVGLYGPLGAGKSTVVRAACRGAGVVGPIPSPTFTIVNEYRTPAGNSIRHVDLYRIEDETELLALGWAEMLDEEAAIFVEWAERAAGHLPARRWDVELGIGADPSTRGVRLSVVGPAPAPPALPC